MRSGKVLIFVVNVILCLAFGFGVLAFYKAGHPYIRGFYCDDESISKPFLHGTISSSNLVASCVVVTVLTVLGVEYMNFRLGYTQQQLTGESRLESLLLHPVVVRCAWIIAAWLYGMGISQFAVDVGKYAIGRLRPHFLSACNPDFTKLNCTGIGGKAKNYIVGDEFCRWTVSEYYRKDARLSFPSGHSSYAGYCGLFLILYIEFEVRYGESYKRIPKLFIETTIALLAFATMLSRISDYKHHPTDVLVGAAIGIFVALVIVFRVLRLRRRFPLMTATTPGAVTMQEAESQNNIVT